MVHKPSPYLPDGIAQFHAAPVAPTEAAVALQRSATIKRLKPSKPGTRRLSALRRRPPQCSLPHRLQYRQTLYHRGTARRRAGRASGSHGVGAGWLRRNGSPSADKGSRRCVGCRAQTVAHLRTYRPRPEAAKTHRQGCPIMAITACPLLEANIHVWQQMAGYGYVQVPSASS